METPLVEGKKVENTKVSAKVDRYQYHDYYLIDDLLTDEHKLVRDAVRDWVKKEVSPIIEDYAQRAEFPKQIIKGLGEIGGFALIEIGAIKCFSNLPLGNQNQEVAKDYNYRVAQLAETWILEGR